MKRIYVLHGWTYSTKRWEPITKWLAEHGIELVMLNVPGLTSPSQDVWTIEKYVAWLDEQLAGEKQPITLIGHSNGGRIALNYDLAHPGRIRRLILIDSAGVYHDELPLQLKRRAFKMLASVGKRFTDSARLRRVLYQMARARDYEQAPPNMRETLTNVTESDKHLKLEQVTAPTIIIWGQNDQITPLADGQTMAKLIKGAKLHVIEGGRHAPFESHYESVGQLIKEATA